MAFLRVLNARSQAIRGLWKRGSIYYAQIRLPGKRYASKIPLKDSEGGYVSTTAEAVAAMSKLRTQRSENALPVLSRTPTLADWVEQYLVYLEKIPRKRESTVNKEKGSLKLWVEKMGHVRLSDLRSSDIDTFLAWRLGCGVSGRTCDLDVIALNGCLKRAVRQKIIRELPTGHCEPLATDPPRRPLWTKEQIEMLSRSAIEHCRRGRVFSDYLWLLAYSGCRRDEALRLTWEDVDWARGQLKVDERNPDDAKGGYSRVVDFNPNLETHLREMLSRKAPDKRFLFPSPFGKDGSTKTFREILDIVREKAKMSEFQLHDLRHFFISMCVMAGIDFMTIASWVGHRDGGILIGKVYGHLADAHKKAQASKLVFSPNVVQLPKVEQSVGQNSDTLQGMIASHS